MQMSNIGNSLVNFVETQLDIDYYLDVFGRCRWSTNVGEPSVYVKYMKTNLNILDVEKKALTLKTPIQLDTASNWWLISSIDWIRSVQYDVMMNF